MDGDAKGARAGNSPAGELQGRMGRRAIELMNANRPLSRNVRQFEKAQKPPIPPSRGYRRLAVELAAAYLAKGLVKQ